MNLINKKVAKPLFLFAIKFFDPVDSGSHVLQEQVKNGKRRHGFHNDDGPRNDDRIVAAFDLDSYVLLIFIHGVLFLENGRDRKSVV